MSKIITYSKIGYNHPSQANWSYFIFKVDFIDTNRNYCYSSIVRDAFGGDSRWKEKLNTIPIETQAVYTKTGTHIITGVQSMLDMESQEFIDKCNAFIIS